MGGSQMKVKKKIIFSLLAMGILGNGFVAKASDSYDPIYTYTGSNQPGARIDLPISDVYWGLFKDSDNNFIKRIYVQFTNRDVSFTGTNTHLISYQDPNLYTEFVYLDHANITIQDESLEDHPTYTFGRDNGEYYYITPGVVSVDGKNSISVEKGTLKISKLQGLSHEKKDISLTLMGNFQITKSVYIINGGTVLQLGAGNKAAHVTTTYTESTRTIFLSSLYQNGRQEEGTEFAAGTDYLLSGSLDKVVIKGDYVVGQNATLSLATNDNRAARAAFEETGLTWGTNYGAREVNAAVYIDKPSNFKDISSLHPLDPLGNLWVNPTLQEMPTEKTPSGILQLDQGSLLMVNAGRVTTDAAISGIQSATINDNKISGAKLFLNGAATGTTYHILEGTKDADLGNVDFGTIFTNNRRLRFTVDKKTQDTGSYYNVIAADTGDRSFLEDTIIKDIASKADGEDDTPAKKFIDNASDAVISPSREDVTNALDSAGNMGELGGATHSTYTNALLSANLAQDHLSISKHEKEMHKDLWAEYIHSRESVDNMKLAGVNKANYEGSTNTITVGSDLYAKNDLVLGLAASYGTGKITSRGQMVRTKNDTKYYGASLYGRKINGKTAYLADISYLKGENDITQYNSTSLLRAKPKTESFSVGVKAEQEWNTTGGSIIPYAGVRYMHLSQEDYKNNVGFVYDQGSQDLFLIPFGVKFITEKEVKNWKVKPMAEMGFIINTGDKSTHQTVHYETEAGDTTNSFGYTVVNGTSFIGKVGVQAENKNVTIGASYQYQKSKDTSDNRLQLNVGYRF